MVTLILPYYYSVRAWKSRVHPSSFINLTKVLRLIKLESFKVLIVGTIPQTLNKGLNLLRICNSSSSIDYVIWLKDQNLSLNLQFNT
jgi:hypothetical protein